MQVVFTLFTISTVQWLPIQFTSKININPNVFIHFSCMYFAAVQMAACFFLSRHKNLIKIRNIYARRLHNVQIEFDKIHSDDNTGFVVRQPNASIEGTKYGNETNFA